MPEAVEAQLQHLRAVGGDYSAEVEVFCTSVEAAVSAASIPFSMALEATHTLRFQQLHTAERIRAQNILDEDLGNASQEERLSVALARARARFDEEQKDADAHSRTCDDIVLRLAAMLQHLGPAVRNLNAETLVALWGAFEVFASDTLRRHVNVSPELGVKLATQEPAKRRLGLRSVSFEALAERGFDLRSGMGDLVLGPTNVASLEALRDLVSVACPDEPVLHAELGSDALRRLWRRRNLIAHRGGVVDGAYMKAGIDDLTIGQRLILQRDDIEAALGTVMRSAQALVDALVRTS